MAKRFTDSEKFRDSWYRKLKPVHKCMWEFMINECSHAGILELDYDSMSFHIGVKVTEEDLLLFESRITFIDEDKIFIASFLRFQQKELNINNPAHKNIIKELEKYDIPQDLETKQEKRPIEGASKGLHSPISKGNSIGKGNGSSKGKTRARKKTEEEFEKFWKECPKKVGKGDARKKYWIARKEVKAELLLIEIKTHAKAMKEVEKEFIPHPATWLHQERYHDEPDIPESEPVRDWPKWKHALAMQIGEDQVKAWFAGARLNGSAVYVPRKFQLQRIEDQFMAGIRLALGDGCEIKLQA